MTMEAFEKAAGLKPDAYWIEAAVGGSPGQALRSRAADFARAHGATHMAWTAHGDECGGFPDTSNERIRELLERTADRRRLEYPDATHYVFFASGRRVTRIR
jgi:hypothetical protein